MGNRSAVKAGGIICAIVCLVFSLVFIGLNADEIAWIRIVNPNVYVGFDPATSFESLSSGAYGQEAPLYLLTDVVYWIVEPLLLFVVVLRAERAGSFLKLLPLVLPVLGCLLWLVYGEVVYGSVSGGYIGSRLFSLAIRGVALVAFAPLICRRRGAGSAPTVIAFALTTTAVAMALTRTPPFGDWAYWTYSSTGELSEKYGIFVNVSGLIHEAALWFGMAFLAKAAADDYAEHPYRRIGGLFALVVYANYVIAAISAAGAVYYLWRNISWILERAAADINTWVALSLILGYAWYFALGIYLIWWTTLAVRRKPSFLRILHCAGLLMVITCFAYWILAWGVRNLVPALLIAGGHSLVIVFHALYFARSVRVRTYLASDEYLRLSPFTRNLRGPQPAIPDNVVGVDGAIGVWGAATDWPASPALTCPRCGSSIDDADMFCRMCGLPAATARAAVAGRGAPFSAQEVAPTRRCPRCGAEIDAGYLFCGNCGMPVDD